AGGRPNLASEAAKRPFQLWADLRAANVTPPNHSEIATDRIRQTMHSGNLIFGITWSYAWNRLETDADSAVKGRIGIAPMPGFEAGRSASCLGGWMVAVSAFSRNKPEAAKFARHLSSPETARVLALQAGHLPVFAELYADPEVLAARPWFAQALPVVQGARPRPITPRYSEVSEVLRANVHAVLGGSKTPEQALSDMGIRLGGIFR
ncbi:MAG: extracellular solute-binding protein, partial [Methylobacterium sp.]|nr:extracellular solute-binding protein [Methylobacterium sp.]